MNYNINPIGANSYTTTFVDKLDLTAKDCKVGRVYLNHYDPQGYINVNQKGEFDKDGIWYVSNNLKYNVSQSNPKYFMPLTIYYDDNSSGWIVDRKIKTGDIVLVKGNSTSNAFSMHQSDSNSCTGFKVKGQPNTTYKILISKYTPSNNDYRISVKNYAVLLYISHMYPNNNLVYCAIPFDSGRNA